MPHSAMNRVGLCVSNRLSVFFKVLAYHTVRIFLLSPAPTRHRHLQQIILVSAAAERIQIVRLTPGSARGMPPKGSGVYACSP
jgi:hypothetical protein